MASYNDTNLNAAMALDSVQEASKDIQGRGWWFNEEKGWKLYPDNNGQIKAPNNVLDITSWNGSVDKTLTLRGGLIYNTYTHSNDLRDVVNSQGFIEFIFVMELPFEDCPPLAQAAITSLAKRRFVFDVDGDVNKLKQHLIDEKRDSDELYSADQRNRKQNAFNNSSVSSFLMRVGGQNQRSYLGPNSTYGLFPDKESQQ